MKDDLIKITDIYPAYPDIVCEITSDGYTARTLLRKKFDNDYYLIPFKQTEETEVSAIQAINDRAKKYFEFGELTKRCIKEDCLRTFQNNNLQK